MRPIIKGLVLASLLVVQVLGQAYPTVVPDPCKLTASQIFEVRDILNCYNHIPVDANRMTSTLASLRQLIQTYSFTDIAMANIAPYNVDLASALDTIAENNYSRDYDFHMDLSRLFNKLNDAHTMYYAPSPYLSCFGVKAFSLSVNRPSKDQNATILLQPQELGANRNWNWPINPTKYEGLEVVAINGQDPRDYLMDYSHHVGTYKDQLVRFNHLFDFVGWGVIDSFTFPISDIPVEVVTVLTAGGDMVNVTVPVKMFCRDIEFKSTSEFIQLIDSPAKKRSIESIELTPDLRKERVRRIQGAIDPVIKPAVDSEMEHLNLFERVELAVKRLKAGTSSLEIVKSVADGSMHFLAFTDDKGNVVPVLKVTSFAPESDADQTAWLGLAVGFNSVLHKFNWTYAIADVNKNGGGIICFTLLLQSLMNEKIASVDVHHDKVLWTPYNLRKTAMFDKIYNSGVKYMEDDYLDMQTGAFDPAQTYYNAESHEVSLPNDVNSTLSKFAYFPGSCKTDINQYLPLVKAWPKNLIITTDGSCGSACAAFMAKMTLLGDAKIVAIGGDTKITSNPALRTASFPGGNVVSWSDMYYYTTKTTPFLTSAMARFNWHQAFSQASYQTYPLEYDYAAFTPTHTLRYWGVVSNDDPLTTDGLQNLQTLYGVIVSIWGDFVQTLPATAPTSAPIRSAPPSPSEAPFSAPDSSPWRGPVDTPRSAVPPSGERETGVAVWVVVVLAMVAVLALIVAAVFALKYSKVKKLLGDESRGRLLPYVS